MARLCQWLCYADGVRAILYGTAAGLVLGAVILVVMSEYFDMNLASF